MEFMTIEKLELILLVGAIVAIVAQRLRIPYTVGLVAAGIGAYSMGLFNGLLK